MSTLLHIDAAAHQSDESVTRTLGGRYIRAWREAQPDGVYLHRDLAVEPAAPIDSAYCALGRRLERVGALDGANVEQHAIGVAELATWRRTKPLIDELLAADLVLIATPMYNFGMPAALKAWIDRVTFPGVLNPRGRPQPLRTTRFVLLAATGGCYGAGSARQGLNFLLPHLSSWLTAYGALPEHIEEVTVEATMAPVLRRSAPLMDVAARSRSAAEAQLLGAVSPMPSGT